MRQRLLLVDGESEEEKSYTAGGYSFPRDMSGRVVVITQEGDHDYRMDLQQYDIHEMITVKAMSLRDAFIFHPSATPPYPSVFSIRNNSILLSLHCIRMIICPGTCYIVSLPKVNEPWNSEGVSSVVHPFLTRLMETLRQKDSDALTFAMYVLDTALQAVLHAYDAELFEAEHDSIRYASHLANISSHHHYMGFVEKVHDIKVQISNMSASANETKEALDAVLDSQVADVWCCDDSKQFEEIVEATYIKVTVSIRRLQILREYIESRQMMARLGLDAKRNQLFGLDLMISTLSMGFGYAGMVAGIWGMNLYNTAYQESKAVFFCVMVSILIGAIGLPLWVRFFMRSRQLTYLPTDTSMSA